MSVPIARGARVIIYSQGAEAFVAEMAVPGVPCSEVSEQGWGRITQLTLPGGGKPGVYQPQHASPLGNE